MSAHFDSMAVDPADQALGKLLAIRTAAWAPASLEFVAQQLDDLQSRYADQLTRVERNNLEVMASLARRGVALTSRQTLALSRIRGRLASAYHNG